MADWEFEHSIYTHVNREKAWVFLSDMRNHTKMEPGVERIELDGPFVSGTTGRTIAGKFTQEWTLTEVIEVKRFVITGITPEGDGNLSFSWEFEEEGSGTLITYRISASGPQVEKHLDEFRQMEINAPKAMSRLAVELGDLA